jgi:hypothetical protein
VDRDWLQDERLEQFDERIHGLDGDCADAVPLLAGRLGRRDAKTLQGLGPVRSVGVQAAVADAIDVDELPHRSARLVLSRPGRKTIEDLVAKGVQRTASWLQVGANWYQFFGIYSDAVIRAHRLQQVPEIAAWLRGRHGSARQAR